MRTDQILTQTDAKKTVTKTIRVLLVDDHAIVRQGLRAVLQTAPDMEVVGEAENGRQAVLEAKKLRPDVVLLDLAMPLLGGVEAARQIRQQVPGAKVLILSSYSDDEHLRQAVEAGAAGYLRKESSGEVLLETVRETYRGDAVFSSVLFGHLLKTWQEGMLEGEDAATPRITFVGRQAEVLQLIAEGHGTKQIASLLAIGEKTVQKHRQVVMDKLKMHKIAALTRYAVATGLIESNCEPVWLAQPPSRPEPRQENILTT